MKWTVEFSEAEVEVIAKAVSVAFMDKEERALVVAKIFSDSATRAKMVKL